jgi:hypothetical protein
METDLIKAQHYRDEANTMRRLAAEETDAQTKNALVSMAEKYDILCQKLIDRTERAP